MDVRTEQETSSSGLALIDLFAGCGGLTSGFVEAGGYRPIAAVENNVEAAATYAANFGEDHVICGDIADWVERDEVPLADVVVGGPPCQGFSNLGHRNSDDSRNSLWRRYVDVLVSARPKAFLLENVDRFFVSRQLQDLLDETQPEGRLCDYEADVHIVRATDHGSAQLRRRTIVIGTHRDFPMIEVPRTRKPVAEWKTVKSALSGIEAWIDPDHRDLPDRDVVRYGWRLPGEFATSELHLTRRYTDLSLQRFECIKEGGNRLDLPEYLKAPCWIGHDKGSLDVMGRMYWDRPSVTIRTEFFKPEKGRYLHPEQNRAISHHEAARLQGFRDDRKWCGSKVAIARQIGNAVPVELAVSMAGHIRDSLGRCS